MFKKKKFYITTSIPYTNAPPHIGHAFEMIQTDVLARYHRQKKEDVFFLTGTDEHGLKTKKAAQAAGIELDQFLDKMAGHFQDLKEKLNLSNDDFIRTTDKSRHIPAVVKLWETLAANGDLYKKKYTGFYCEGCEAFKTEKELVDGKCIIHQKPVEKIEEENYFFKLSKYLPKVKELIKNYTISIIPETKKQEIVNMIENGLEDISFSRSKDKYEGVPVPGDSSQIVYVWADALPNYISAIGYGQDEKKFKKYWPADVHCIGKDILKFHAIYWPAMLLSLDISLPKKIFVHGFITVDGQKMSKSLGNVVDPFELVKKYGTDAVRYFLLREIPSTEDGDFSYQKFETRYNADLAGGIGNLVARVLGISKNIEVKSNSSKKIQEAVTKTEKQYQVALDEYKFNEALAHIWGLIGFCDRYINEEKLWETKKPEVIADLFFAINSIGLLLNPFMPETANKIVKAITEKKSQNLFPRLDKGA